MSRVKIVNNLNQDLKTHKNDLYDSNHEFLYSSNVARVT